ncbi:prefoldin subunit 1 [Tremella mesenterica]|uniref:Prefoldin subunit 1 n=1 Tax=Tremella mesenterica TaxID=5217 RepID=A0A4V1M3T1_TREME|nr:uncharacterized protein TREMEDRAFT_37759 [Tremella mesenterica DSM 1558]EIW71349.1 hypothetical protein TREMEDRAFT_37759 [Tremella mesenterica DSM 1558]RXK37947.1 prefoldin subunit 1 [Tremella mesenterica]
MSNLSDDTLRKILEQIHSQAINSQRNLSVARAQIQSKEKERRILQLTMKELATVPEPSKMYKGVGKMFMIQPRAEIKNEQTTLEKTMDDDLTNLTKKAKFLERQFEEANGQLKDIFHSQQQQS